MRSLAGKIATGLIALLVISGGISWWRMDEAQRDAVLSAAGLIGGWLGIVLLLPWVAFSAVRWVAHMDSNPAGAALIVVLTLGELLLLGLLLDWSFTTTGPGWTGFAVGGLFAAAYNVLACDWIAERLS